MRVYLIFTLSILLIIGGTFTQFLNNLTNITNTTNTTITTNLTNLNDSTLNRTSSNISITTNITNMTGLTNITDPLMKKYLNGTFLKTSPSLIPEMAQNNTECFVKLRSIIGYFSDFEQALLLRAAKENKESNRCFDCEFYFKNLPTVFERQMKFLSDKLSGEQVKRRDALKCLFNIGMGRLDSNLNNSLSDQLMNYMYIRGETNQCLALFLSDMGKILFLRRRFICAKLDDMNIMSVKDTSGNIVGFKWTDEEARNMTNSFVTLTQCVNKDRYTLPQVVVNSISTLAMSSNCSKNVNASSDGNVTIPGSQPVVIRNNSIMMGPVA
jgi:hypothetical protein